MNITDSLMSSKLARRQACKRLRRLFNDAAYISRDMRWYLAFVFPAVGCVNFGIVLLGTFKRSASSTSYFHMLVIGVADLYAIVSVETQYLMNYFGHPFNDVECVLKQFHKIGPSQIAIWFLVLMTIDRAKAVPKPLQAVSICTIKRSCKLLFVTAVLLTVQNLGWCSQFESIKYRIWTNCQIVEKYVLFAYYATTNTISLYVPFVVISVANWIIISSVRKSAKLPVAKGTASYKKQGASNKITALVVTTALAFLCFTFPMCLFDTLVLEKGSLEETTTYYVPNCRLFGSYAWFVLFGHVGATLLYRANHVLNGFIYLASSEQFRKDLLTTICNASKR
ncbi:allatostatin-A receptor-like [Tubulanus polymorphus]|uniref:allatostatin-A receptor-like n=1 Tax=Tubulanus polymorphus TaxID=672921 RepID=UPI003DA4428F